MRGCAVALLCAPSLSAACDDAAANKALDSDPKLLNRCTNLDTKNGCAFRRKPCNPTTCTDVCKDIGTGWSCESSTDFSGKLNGSDPHSMQCGFITRDRGCNDHNPGGCWFSCTCIPPSNSAAEFAAWKEEHGRSYPAAEEARRARIFADNMRKAAEVAKREPLATFGASPYADLTEEEFSSRHAAGAFFASANATDLPQAELLPIAAKAGSVDWRAKGAVTAVKDQKQCGSCWAFSTTGNIEGQAFLAGHPLTPLSEQQLISCDKGYGDMGCMGGLPSNAYKYVAEKGGLESEADYPLTCTLPLCLKKCTFDASKVATQITKGIAIQSDEAQMLAWLTKNGPISIGVNAAGSAWQTYTGGIMTNCASKQPDHGVLIVGYGEEGSQPYWIVKNSWNAKWGEAGYVRLAYGTNQCNIVSTPTSAVVA